MSKEKVPGWSYSDDTDMRADEALLSPESLGTVRHAQSQWVKSQEAGDQKGMDYWHGVAEGERAKSGYSGGENGGGYIALAPTVKEPDYGEASTEYKEAMDRAIQTLQGRGKFTYDPEIDPSYQEYKDQYTRLGKQAMEDSFGHAAMRTGGLGGSAALSASQQAYNGYMQALADKIPELRKIAYQMYQDEEDSLRRDIDLYGSLDQQQRRRWEADRDFARGAFESDRSFDYNKGVDQWNMVRQLDRDAKADAETEYQHGQDSLNWAWLQDERDYTRQREAAELAAQGGDYSGYKALYGLTDEQAAALAAMSKQERDLTIQSLELDNEYKRAQIGAANRSNRGGSGSGGSGKVTAKPTLTYDQMRKAIEAGDITDNVRYAYEYYMGVPLEDTQEADGSKASGLGNIFSGLTGTAMKAALGRFGGQEQATGASYADLSGRIQAIPAGVTPDQMENLVNEIDRALDAGTITRAQYDELGRKLGYQ